MSGRRVGGRESEILVDIGHIRACTGGDSSRVRDDANNMRAITHKTPQEEGMRGLIEIGCVLAERVR